MGQLLSNHQGDNNALQNWRQRIRLQKTHISRFRLRIPIKTPPLVRIELVIPLSELKTKFGPPLKSFVEQCKIDDLESQEYDIPELVELDYPAIDILLDKNPALISKLIEKYMYFDLLDAIFYKNPRNMWSVAINNIDSAAISDEALVVVGRGYEIT